MYRDVSGAYRCRIPILRHFWSIGASQLPANPEGAAHDSEKPQWECESQTTSGSRLLHVGERASGSCDPVRRFSFQENRDFALKI